MSDYRRDPDFPNPNPVQSSMTNEAMTAVDRAFVERLKTDPENVAAQLLALTQISDWARVNHRDNFDAYLIAAAELLTLACQSVGVEEMVAILDKSLGEQAQGVWTPYVGELYDGNELTVDGTLDLRVLAKALLSRLGDRAALQLSDRRG